MVVDPPKVGKIRGAAQGLRKAIPTKYDDAIIGLAVGIGVGLYSMDAQVGILAGASMVAPETVQNTSDKALSLRMGRDAASYHPLVAAYETGEFLITGSYNLGGWMQSNGYGIFPHVELETADQALERLQQ